MYTVEQTQYGFKHVFSGRIEGCESKQWFEEMEAILAARERDEPFALFVDMRDINNLDDQVRIHFNQALFLCREHGMARSVVVLTSSVLTLQLKQLSIQSRRDQLELYINASKRPSWEKAALDWLIFATPIEDSAREDTQQVKLG